MARTPCIGLSISSRGGDTSVLGCLSGVSGVGGLCIFTSARMPIPDRLDSYGQNHRKGVNDGILNAGNTRTGGKTQKGLA